MQKTERKTGLKMEMAVRRALGYIQVGGSADGAADAAPSPASCARGRRSQAHAPNGQTNRKQKTGLPKSIVELFGKRSRNGANRAVCHGKPPSKRSLRRRESAAERSRPANPLGAGFRFFPPRTAFFPSVLFRLLCTVQTRRAFVTSLSATALSHLCRSTVLCILPLSSTRNRQKV